MVEAIIKANPKATTALDPAGNKKKFDPKSWAPAATKGCRWMRKIAEETKVTPEVRDVGWRAPIC